MAKWSWSQTFGRCYQALMPLKTRRVEGLMRVKSVEAESSVGVLCVRGRKPKCHPVCLIGVQNHESRNTCPKLVSKQLLELKDAVQEYLDDMEDAENYRDRYIEICSRVDLKIREIVAPTETEKRSVLNYRKSN
ncbi:uncharacterized protein TNCV_4991901 [Trichonephila clavipes]|nr:uncharacterized protein TNCV_4991901 [Trichonephila clavipes]